MRKAVIIDDEIWAIEGLKKAVNWPEIGYEIAATLTSSVKALDYISKNKVDVAIVDIKMPNIDGLALIGKLRESNINIKIIIVSGLMEFENARKAVALGVEEFLVKPVDVDSLKSVLIKIREMLDKSESTKITDMEEFSKGIKLFKNVSNKNVYTEYLNLKKPYSYYYSIMSGFLTAFEMNTLTETISTSGELLRFSIFGRYMITAVFTDVYLEYSNTVNRLKSEAAAQNLGISEMKSSPDDIQKSVSECRQAFFNSFITGEKGVYECRGDSKKLFDIIMQNVNDCANKKNLQKLDVLISKIFSPPVAFNIDELILISNNILVTTNLVNPAESFDYLPPLDKLEERFSNIFELENYLHCCVETLIMKQEEDHSAEVKKNIMPLIKEYIDKNFQENISLFSLSEKFSISEKYLSKLFKSYTGENYISYVNRIRVNTALKMLAETNLSIQEISEACGYSDYTYFARVFKKLVGVNATEKKKQTIK